MKTFAELNEQAANLKDGFEATPITDATALLALDFFAEVKNTCESYTDTGMIYEADGANKYNVRLMRDMSIAALNYTGNKQILKARFYSVWQQINSIVY